MFRFLAQRFRKLLLREGKDDMKKEQDRQKKELLRGPVIAFTMVC